MIISTEIADYPVEVHFRVKSREWFLESTGSEYVYGPAKTSYEEAVVAMGSALTEWELKNYGPNNIRFRTTAPVTR